MSTAVRWTEDQYKQFQKNKKENEIKILAHDEKKGSGRFKNHVRCKMNKTEKRLELMLCSLKKVGEIKDYSFEAVTFKLAEKMRYTPDFRIVYPDGKIKFIEVKGAYITERGDLKFKFAIEKYPEYKWEMWQWKESKWHIINGN